MNGFILAVIFSVRRAIGFFNGRHVRADYDQLLLVTQLQWLTLVFDCLQVAHTVSTWLTLSLALWRYKVLKKGGRNQRKSKRSQKQCLWTIMAAYIGSIILCVPSFITYGIQTKEIQDNVVVYVVHLSAVAKLNDGLLLKVNQKY